MATDWQIVYTTSHIHLAQITISLLAENNIPAVLDDRRDSSYIMLGDISVLVNAKNVIPAKFIIENNQL